jgi:hypothetical protein
MRHENRHPHNGLHLPLLGVCQHRRLPDSNHLPLLPMNTIIENTIILNHLEKDAKRDDPNQLMVRMYHKDLESGISASKLHSMTLTELSAHIKESNGKAVKLAKQSLALVGQTGLALIALKEKLGHGRFMREVECQTGIHHRTATNYMKIADQYGNVSNLRGVRDALKYIGNAAKAATAADESEFSSTAPLPECLTTTPAPPLSVIVDADVVDVELDADDGPPVLTVDGTKEESEPIASHHGHLDSAQYYMDLLTLTELKEMFVWIDANRKRMIKFATTRQKQADLFWFAVELGKRDAAAPQGEKEAQS